MQKLLLLFFVLLTLNSNAQTDLLLLKKRGITQKTFVKGSYIQFKFLNDQWIEGSIKEMRDDSLWVNMFSVRSVSDYFGFPKLDTAFYGLLKLHISDIKAFPLPDRGGKYISNGILFILGGLGYMFLNLVNGFILNESMLDPNNLSKLGIAAGVTGLGFLLKNRRRTEIPIRHKYSLQVVSGTKNE
jgi:hypothetical protein